MIGAIVLDQGPLRFERLLDQIIKGFQKLLVGIVPNEGEDHMLDFYLNQTATDRGTNLQLGLFTNTTIGETTTHAAITEPTGGNYARITLTDGSWAQSVQGRLDYPQQQFAPNGAYSAPVYGYFVCSNGTTKRLVIAEIDPNGPYSFVANDTYDVTVRLSAE